MKINPYYAAAGIALVVILVILFTQRSNWNKDKFILSADDSGNLTPISEDYFDNKEKALLAKVDAKLAQIDKNKKDIKALNDGLMDHTCQSGKYGGCSTVATHFRGMRGDGLRGKHHNDARFKSGV